jgi:hypothetical protein
VRRDESAHHDTLEIEGVDLDQRQRQHEAAPGPAGQQIRMPAPQLRGTRSREEERVGRVLDQPVHLVEQGGDLLHFVDDDHPGGASRESLAQQRGPRRVLREDIRLQQIDRRGVRVVVAEPVALADATRAPEEGGLPTGQPQIEQPLDDLAHEGRLS